MGADSSGSQDSKDPNHIWLRQSVTFTVNGQTRTVEMALPLRPGATPGEVEALLDEADAGMRRLSRRLDAHLATLTNHASDDERQPVSAPAAPAAPATPARAATPPPSPAPMSTPMSAPMSAEPAADLSIRDFVAAITALGYTQRQVMEKLNVRSLAGLNLRESLEALHRQALLEGAPSAQSSAQSSAPASAPPSHPAPPLAFEEEDGEEALSGEPEMELSYPDPASRPDEDEDEDEQPPAPAPTLDVLKRDARLTPAAKLPPAQRRPSPPPAAPAAPEPEVEEPLAARAQRLLTELRALRGGGEASDHQRAALANIVVSELTERGVAALAKDVWNITPDEMGPEQYDALISWGKRDHFKDEAREVIKAARAAGPPPMVATPPDEPESELEDAPDEPPPPPARGGRGSRARGSASDAPRSDA